MTQICFYLVGCDVFISLSVFTICVISDSVTLAKTEECVLKHTVTLRNSIFLISLCVWVCVCVFSTHLLNKVTESHHRYEPDTLETVCVLHCPELIFKTHTHTYAVSEMLS